MLTIIQQLLTRQFEASLCTVGHCLAVCPAELWQKRVAKFPFSQSVFHTLFFTDFYLEPNDESLREQPFHREHASLFGDYEQLQDREPVSTYDKQPLLMYLDFCCNKARRVVAEETEQSLAARADFKRCDCTRAELHVYNIRHIQHHAAQLILRLRQETDIDIPWIEAGWRKLPPIA